MPHVQCGRKMEWISDDLGGGVVVEYDQNIFCETLKER